MIFITVGSQKFQFNRLLIKVDNLIEKGALKEEVVAQIGECDYIPKNYKYTRYMNRDEFQDAIQSADIVITHGGTGAIITAVKNKKKVIAVPRLAKYGEHVDDHQLQIVEQFTNVKLIDSVLDIDELDKKISEIRNKKFATYKSNTQNIIDSIDEYLQSLQ